MSNNGGVPYGSDEPTSFGLQPPSPAVPGQQPGGPGQPSAVPYPGNPYAAPTQVVPQQQARTDAQVDAQEPGAGRLIAGRYRLLSKLGHGGMGTVWRAKDETVDREVAVKEPRVPDHLPERERANAFERMRREARAAARLDHPAVVNVHDVAVVDGQPWIVMELVRGRSLGDALQEGTLGVREAARVGLEVLGALEAAHAAGILHRDVKPDNVLLGRHDRVVLTDFGIAQIEGETNLTDTGGFVGSPEYIAPERVLGQRPGPASDLWSLGVVLYTATEGVSPFRRSNTPATLQSVLNSTPAPPGSAAGGPLAEAINGLLDKDPSRRPGAGQVRSLLEDAAKPPAPAPTQVVRIEGQQTAGQLAGPGAKGLRVGRKALFGLGAAVVAAAVAAYLVIADPFAGPLPDGWKKHHVQDVAATLAAPASYKQSTPDRSTDKGHWVTYTDPSGSIWIGLTLAKKAEDTSKTIKDSSAAEMYADNDTFKADGEYDLGMPGNPKTDTNGSTTYQGNKSAENTVRYTTTDSQNPRPRELKIFYYKSKAGDMYKLTISYPGQGDFTARGREVARTAIANLDIDKL
ncbi:MULTISPECIES: serine/threonine-protein kinase [unclassified Streptomyces]|uniref:serine/threonine-protein kinase n=1 Tax=unclassified Streptomyces TaxID=2593676 RepID=UPI002E8073AF|nr:serine/threonine-protein kinase [Streptomyces sp. NBC_00589]WTI36846.1 serine/threonine protein kinase [Streptomyces sp. NBC_00775]WUB29478.1 serine/threonine protein kinase [Streptomyces sp. NBC_00589]